MSMFFLANWDGRSRAALCSCSAFWSRRSGREPPRQNPTGFVTQLPGGRPGRRCAAAITLGHGGIALRVPPGRSLRPVGGPAGRDVQSGRGYAGAHAEPRKESADGGRTIPFPKLRNSETQPLTNVQANKCKQPPAQKPSVVQTEQSAGRTKRNPGHQKKKSEAKT